ncbi:hypothetical protein LTR62_006276 [Meristemomyces frigidus]|uniref:thioredoxin-dependent peroxiredoxin n=1 Tax=Meristemomyces frigidus TaxID=1508187 RepID=A0AAN7TEK5_9PEZI|nr:hypothetical protein LTR62_006276 [Meristemomyces frigidus]
MVELRKRPAPPPAAPPKAKKPTTSKAKTAKAPAVKKSDAPKETEPPASNPANDPAGGIPEGAGGVSATAEVIDAEVAQEIAAEVQAEAVKGKGKKTAPAKSSKSAAPEKGGSIDLEGFGGEIQMNDGEKTTLAKLVEQSKAGVVLFTYPKASTPGCTTQACLFRDAYEPLTATGLSIYGLSTDSPKANSTFKTKQSLPYPLLCDQNATLIQAIGMKKAPKGTTRGVFVVDKSGKVLAAEAGGPAPTVEVVKKLVQSMGGDAGADGVKKAEETAGREEE